MPIYIPDKDLDAVRAAFEKDYKDWIDTIKERGNQQPMKYDQSSGYIESVYQEYIAQTNQAYRQQIQELQKHAQEKGSTTFGCAKEYLQQNFLKYLTKVNAEYGKQLEAHLYRTPQPKINNVIEAVRLENQRKKDVTERT